MVSLSAYAKAVLTCSHSYALLLAQKGAKVVVNDVSLEAAQRVVDEIVQSGCNVGDITD